MLRHELFRAFHTKEWWISLVTGIIITVMQYFMAVVPAAKELDFAVRYEMIPHSVFSKWIGANGSTFASALYFFVLPLLATLPFGAAYYKDRKSGYNRQMVLQSGRKVYLLSQYAAVFVSAGLVVTIPLLINLILAALTLPSIRPVLEAGYFPLGTGRAFLPSLYYADPYLYTFIYLTIDFLFAGTMAGAALVAAPFAENIFMVWVTPFVLIACLGALAGFFGHPELSSMFFLHPKQSALGVTWYSLLIWLMILFCLSFFIYYKKGLSDDIY